MKLIGIAALVHLIIATGCAVDATTFADEPEDNLASSSEELCRKNALSPTEEQTALKLIDDICGDTWCEGDNDFAFQKLTCTAPTAAAPGTCKLKLRIIPSEGAAGYPRTFSRSCTTPSFTGYASLVETSTGGYTSLDWDYYLALTDCISALEDALRR
jgi:hypothetical protein